MIRTHGLAYAYAGGTALRFDDVLVPQGGVLLLKGPSGAGKSTWLALAAGLVAPSQGQIEVAGQVLEGGATDRWRARNIGFLPQKLHLRPAPGLELSPAAIPYPYCLEFCATGPARCR